MQAQEKKDDLSFWMNFVAKYFSPRGSFRHTLWIAEDVANPNNKQYEITYPALARYFHTHFDSGIQTMQLILTGTTERQLPTGQFVDCEKASFVYWFDNGSQVCCMQSHLRTWLTMSS